jgi:hypothetical protein
MKTALVAAFLFAATAIQARADDAPRFQVGGALGRNYASGSAESIHLAVAPSFSLNKHFSIGADLAYSYLPLASSARGGGNRAYWGLATLTAEALPSHAVSPYLTLGYGLGRYADTRGDAEFGRAAALGAGLSVRLNPRVHLFVESRFGMMDNIVARDGLHLELPIKVGVRAGF